MKAPCGFDELGSDWYYNQQEVFMSPAKNGDKVKVHYIGKFESGEVFDSSREREPFEFTLGQGQVIPGFEKEIEGMEVGQTKTITIAPEEAYGQRRDDVQEETITLDANHPLAGKALIFEIELLEVA